jgi:hypothetical protein
MRVRCLPYLRNDDVHNAYIADVAKHKAECYSCKENTLGKILLYKASGKQLRLLEITLQWLISW